MKNPQSSPASLTGLPSPAESGDYWEGRARRFATDGAGLRAVCSYGMPGFYNTAIHYTQTLALAPWLDVEPGTPVLDVGCGVGRWSIRMARRGAQVTGVDLSPTMVEEAGRRARLAGVGERCTFRQGDLAGLDLGRRFRRILGVTVLQHILDRERLRAAVARLAAHLEPGGRMVLLEAAPDRATTRCDTAVFHARTTEFYRQVFSGAGLRCADISGVDPAPFKTWYLPHYSRLPEPIRVLGLALVTAASLPVDLMLGRAMVRASWHKVFRLEHED